MKPCLQAFSSVASGPIYRPSGFAGKAAPDLILHRPSVAARRSPQVAAQGMARCWFHVTVAVMSRAHGRNENYLFQLRSSSALYTDKGDPIYENENDFKRSIVSATCV